MDKMTRRAAAIAADKLLAAAGYSPKAISLKAAEKKKRAIAEVWGRAGPPGKKKKRKRKAPKP